MPGPRWSRSRRLDSLLMKIINRLPRSVFYPAAYGRILRLLQQRDAGQSPEGAVQSQLARLLRLAVTAVPYYRNLGLAIDPLRIVPANAFEILARFPLLEKRHIMACPEQFVAAGHRISRLQMGTSGGSTGEGVRVFYDTRQRLIERCFFDYRWHRATGWHRSARMVRIGCDGVRDDSDHPCTRRGDRLLVSPYHLNKDRLEEVLRSIQAFAPRYFHAYPSSLARLAAYMRETGLRLQGIRGIFLASEQVTSRHLDEIGLAFPQVPVVFHYGLTERVCLAWGQCRDGDVRYRFDDLYGCTELQLDSHGREEIVGTGYWNDLMPLIRYRTQDYASGCGQGLYHLDGREQEFLVTRAGGLVPGFAIVIDPFTWDYVEQVQVVQREAGRIELHIRRRHGYSADVEERILSAQRLRWGGMLDVHIVHRESGFHTRAGKTRLVINQMRHGHAQRGSVGLTWSNSPSS